MVFLAEESFICCWAGDMYLWFSSSSAHWMELCFTAESYCMCLTMCWIGMVISSSFWFSSLT